MKKSLFSFTLPHLEEEMASIGHKPYRARQIYSWLYVKHQYDISQMSDLSKDFREFLEENYETSLPNIVKKQIAGDGTIKLLLEFDDGGKVETVLMRYDYGNVICVSSQIGCNMGCVFCASGILKKERNLSAGEMMGEVLIMNRLLEETGERVTHVVVMGTGEPFDNYDEVMEFVHSINEQKGLAIGARHITVSTCGFVPGILKYGDEGIQINLAISLHAPNDEIRNKIMPISKAYPISKLMEAVKIYENKAGRRVTFEYILLKGINDSLECADELSDLIRGTLAYVNIIPYNPIAEKPYERSPRNAIKAFADRLMKRGINCTIRKEFGTDIDAACGQLRIKYGSKKNG